MTRLSAAVTIRPDGAWVVGGTPPPAPTYKRITPETDGIVGQPCVWLDGRGAAWEYGWRIAGLPWMDQGRLAITICKDAEWWQSRLSGESRPREMSIVWADYVWLVAYEQLLST